MTIYYGYAAATGMNAAELDIQLMDSRQQQIAGTSKRDQQLRAGAQDALQIGPKEVICGPKAAQKDT